MKELSIEEKAKRYDEAIKIAKEVNNEHRAQPFDVMTRVFPELKESDDEGIRNFLIDFIKVCGWTEKKDQGWPLKEECIAWLEKQDGHAKFINGIQVGDKVTRNKDGVLVNLSQLNRVAKKDEKQGKQKPADKVEPKFKIGDFIVNDYCMGRIVEITNDAYLLDTEQGIPFSCHSTRLWDITKDAKDGDVLSYNDGHGNDSIELIKSITGKKIEFWFCLTNGNDYEVFDGVIPYTNFASREGATPATKEQRDFLFQKMHEAGYEWDVEKKELKKIEQSPIEEINGEDYGIDGLWHAQTILEKTLGSVDGYQSNDGILEHKCAISAVKKLYEHNPAWSEEDEQHIYSLLKRLDDLCRNEFKRTRFAISEDRDWLKSLKERYTWKPSDEQMSALSKAIAFVFDSNSDVKHSLESLYNELKKL